MLTGANFKVYRPQHTTIGVRQQVMVRAFPALSKRMIRLTTMIVLTGFIAVSSLSLFIRHQIVRTAVQVEQMQSARFMAGSENIKLLSIREQMAAKSSVVDLAAERLQLQPPGKRQIQHI